jgi:GT2 family glycosyltransferase
MKLSIVIVNYNVKYFLEQCLFSLQAATRSLDAEVFVVDNHSSDGSAAYIQARFKDVTIIENDENTGFSKACNQAIGQASGDYILLLNPDTIVGESVLATACAFMAAHPGAGAAGVKMLDGNGVFLPESKRGFPSPWNAFCKMTGLSRLMPESRLFGQYHLRYLDENQVHEVDVLSGAFMLIRSAALQETGLLDEKFFMYGEDIDLSYRIRLAGYKNYYLPLKIIHYKGASTKKDFRYVKIFHGAMLVFFNKHFPHYGKLFRLMIQLSILFQATVFALRNVFRKRKQPPFYKEKTFVAMDTSYEKIIDTMEQMSAPGQTFSIFYPQTGIKIGFDNISPHPKQYQT